MFKLLFGGVLALSLVANAQAAPPAHSFILKLQPTVASLSDKNGVQIQLDLTNPNAGYVSYSYRGPLSESLHFKVWDEHGKEVKSLKHGLRYLEYSPRLGMPSNTHLSFAVDLLNFIPDIRPGSYIMQATLDIGYEGWTAPDTITTACVPLTITP